MPRTEEWHPRAGILKRRGRNEATPPPPPPPAVERFPGDPNPKVTGKTWWGEAHGTNGSVSSHETATGHVVPIRRRYWSSMADIVRPNGSLFQAVREDHAAGRLPWVSFKTAWKQAADGGLDAEFDAVIAELESYAKPTWVIINHEPENDYEAVYGSTATSAEKAAWTAENAPHWRGQQARFRQRMNAYGALNGGIRRIAFGGSLMYYTFNPTSGRDPLDWYPGAGVWDYHGNDHYTEVKQEIHRTNPWEYFVTFCEDRNLPFTLPEWGLRGEDPNGPTKMQNFYNRMLDGTHDCVAFGYFDSSANSTGTGWTLTNENGLLNKYHSIMQDPRSITLAEMGY